MYWSSHSTLYTIAFKLGLLVIPFLVNCGNCKERKSHPEDSSSPSAIKTTLDHHIHSKWDSWPTIPQDKKSLLPWDQMPNIVPLTVQEHTKRQTKSREEDPQTSSEDLGVIREKALSFGKLVLNFVAKQVLAPPEDLTDTRESRSFKYAQDRQEGGGEGDGNRNRVIDWVARLIGVQGKTLGEFLREYQVHVLYDLVFTFFKWIFFLYAGLLIP